MQVHDALVKDGGGGTPYSFIADIYHTYIKDKNIDTIVEIGVYNGCFLLPITLMNNNKKTYGIDPYKTYIQKDIDNKPLKNIADSISTNQLFLDNVYSRLLTNIQKFNLNIEIYKDCAENVYDKFADDSIDILRIDGNHDSSYVMKDLSLYVNKIKRNGIILMDDTDWPSVDKALSRFLSTHTDIILETRGSTYCVLRKKQMKVYISCGWECTPRAYIKTIGFSKESGYLSCPFDLCITTWDAFKKCLETDFEFFYDNLHLEDLKDIGNYPLPGNSNTYDIFNVYGMRFNHESPSHCHMFRDGQNDTEFYIRNDFLELKKRYNARISNFRKYMTTSDEVCLVFSYNPGDKIEELLEMLRKRYPDTLLSVLCI